jgi:hypothetical protein
VTDALHERLNKILPRVTSEEFIGGRGLGNEVRKFSRRSTDETAVSLPSMA